MATMRQFYEGKRFVKLVITTPACPLEFNPRLGSSPLYISEALAAGVLHRWIT
jgi:hypothetical protein